MKKEDILDDFTEPDLPPSRKGVDKIIWIYAVVTAILFLIYDLFLKDVLPSELISGSSSIRTKGLFIFFIIIINCNLFIRKANQLAPNVRENIFVIWGASSIFYGSLIFRIIYEFVIYNNFNLPTVWFSLKISMALSICAGVISYVVINRIRGNNMLLPYLILIGVWVATGYLLKIIL